MPRLHIVFRQYSIALLSVGVALLLKLVLNSLIGARTPFLLFFGAVILSALRGGVRAGILATLLSGLVVDFFFLDPIVALALTPTNLIQVAFFILEGTLISFVIGRMQRAQRQTHAVTLQLAERETQYRQLVDLSPDTIFIQQQGKIVFINRAGVKLLGATETAQLLSRSVLEIIAPAYRTAVQERIHQLLELQQPVALVEEQFLQLDGTPIDVEVVASPLIYAGQPAAQVIVRDIRERKQREQILQDTLQRLNFHIDNSPVALIEWDANFRVSRWSRQAQQIFGWTADEVTGKQPDEWKFVFVEDVAAASTVVAQLWEGTKQQVVSFNRNYTKTGGVLDCEWYNSALLDEAGNLVSVLSWVLDVSTRKQAEAERNQLLAGAQAAQAEAEVQRNRLYSLLLQAPALICIQRGPDHMFEFANPRYRQVVGNRELIGKTSREVFPDLEGQGIFELLDNVFQTGTPFVGAEVSAQFDRQGNGTIEEGFFNFIYQPTYDIHGQVEGIITFAFEVTDQVVARRQAEALAEDLRAEQMALRRSEARFSRLVESNIIGVILAEADGNITEANDAFLEIVGYGRDDLNNGVMRWFEMTPPEYQERDQQGIRELSMTGRCTPFEKEYIRKDGSRVPILIGAALLEEDQTSWVCFVLDLTESKQVEALLRQQAEELVKANRLKDEFLTTLSHELKTPLNAILGWSTMLLTKTQDAATVNRALETIQRNARAQNQLIEDLLDVSRIITGKLRLNVRPVVMVSVIEAAIESVRPAADAKNIRIQSVLDPSAGPVSGDPDRLQQVFWNLLSNAIKFTPKNGRVQIRLERINSHVEVMVSDTGQGIRPDFLPYVFERLQQADGSTTRHHGGLGLGLAIVRQLVELHGGSVRAESAGEGQGAAFTVVLPIAIFRSAPLDEARVHPSVSDQAPPISAARLDGLTVLIVDDEADARELLAVLLQHCGATVLTVASAAEALAVITQSPPTQRPGLLVSDIGMPEEDGYTLIQQVRALSPAQGGTIPAIALTAYARTADRIKALSSGFNSHVPKPVEPAEFITVVANLVHRI
ncbi:PAS domain S-box protein [Leptolyngbya sp. FACHB-17]|uniref:hybrid sensor histidine kinase/response regulator n=1 Tax=Leptolyngbyales TaxID=3079749 RepID=UPI00168197C7|nr:PAS domain S-box protein [Leptolyngbya sp. FACHB-17]MBD2082883.1 PAS domain S-box protein [Leptolyngbya sp. FACHB-17]